jgi:hypothetical protein
MMPVGAKIVSNIAIGIIYICTIPVVVTTIAEIKNILSEEAFDDEES